MKRTIIACALATVIALPATAGTQTRKDIMDRVIWPCVDHEVQELGLQENHSEPVATIVLEFGRDFCEGGIDAVEAAFRERTDDNNEWIYAVGLVACIQNQDTWAGELE